MDTLKYFSKILTEIFSKMDLMKIHLLLSGRISRLYTIKGNTYEEENYINNLKYVIINRQ